MTTSSITVSIRQDSPIKVMARDTVLKLICVDKLENLDTDVREEFLMQIEEETEGFQFFVTTVTSGQLKIETSGGAM